MELFNADARNAIATCTGIPVGGSRIVLKGLKTSRDENSTSNTFKTFISRPSTFAEVPHPDFPDSVLLLKLFLVVQTRKRF
jgi:hypothetical protein